MPVLTPDQLQTALLQIPLWHLAEGKLVRSWTFPTFLEAIAFVNQIATLGESQDHHPDIDIRYNRADLALISHDLNGVTDRDLRFALAVDKQSFGEKK